MEIALDEASLVPSDLLAPDDRVSRLAKAVKALDELGAPRSLRAVRDAPDRDIGGGRGLRHHLRISQDKDLARLIALRLTKQPYIDGPDGLFVDTEESRLVEPSIDGVRSFGGGYVAHTDGVLLQLIRDPGAGVVRVVVQLHVLTDDAEWTDEVDIDAVDSPQRVESQKPLLVAKINAGVQDGPKLIERLPELFPNLILGERAREQLAGLDGSEPYFRQVLRHLRALSEGTSQWRQGSVFKPAGVTSSPESATTLDMFKDERTFPTPDGFEVGPWSHHTKLTGGNGARLYYKVRPISASGTQASSLQIAVGYVGPHLRTKKYR